LCVAGDTADTRAIYDAMAADYAAVEDNPYNAYYEQPNLRALLPPVSGRRVLDAGCGAGRTSEWLVEQGAEVVGIDASHEMLRRARERVPAASFALADLAEPLAFEDASFDLAVAGLVMHYLRDWVPTLRELRRVLRPGGIFVLSTHHPVADAELAGSGDYFAVELLHDCWTFGERQHEVRFWHRSLSGMFGEIRDGGFRIDELVEPRPLPQVRERFPDHWERLTTRPHFLLLRLIAVER
jgi:SAM-dependent methyltransferase